MASKTEKRLIARWGALFFFFGLFGFLSAFISPDLMEWDEDTEVIQINSPQKHKIPNLSLEALLPSTPKLPKVVCSQVQIPLLKDSQFYYSILNFSQQLRAPPTYFS